jgi:hypothetical protein
MKRALLGLAAASCCVWWGCRADNPAALETGDDGQVVPAANEVEADDYVLDTAGATTIVLDTGSISVSGGGVTVEGTTATITRAGTYVVQGTLADGQVKIDAGAAAKVKLVLDGVSITTTDDAPIFVRNAAKAVLYLAPGTVNTLTDGVASTRDGVIHCNTKLSIFGPGRLKVAGNVDDGINAQGGIILEDGVYDIRSLESGIKSDINLIVNGGTYTIDAGNDGLHGEESLTVNGGDVTVARSAEGLEGATVTLAGGTIHVAASDDGVNTSPAGDRTTTGVQPGMGGGPGAGGSSSPLYVRGGYLYANANGDGLDVNGPVEMTGGTIILDGPTANDNGALDYQTSFQISGGYLLAVGSSGMALAPSRTSPQNSIGIAFSTAQAAGTLVHVRNAAGDDILTFRPAKRYQTVVLSSPLITRATGYSLYVGGSSTGTERDGLFTGGTHYGGTKKATFDVSSALTVVSAS